jgi:hypothetical protein
MIGSGAKLTAPAGTFKVAGSWDNEGTFDNNSGTVIFDGTGPSIISGSTVFYDLYSTTPGKIITFANGTTQTVTHSLILTGADDNPVTINATGIGAIPKLSLSPSAAQSITDVSVTNNDASGGVQLSADGYSSLSGITTNWIAIQPPPAPVTTNSLGSSNSSLAQGESVLYTQAPEFQAQVFQMPHAGFAMTSSMPLISVMPAADGMEMAMMPVLMLAAAIPATIDADMPIVTSFVMPMATLPAPVDVVRPAVPMPMEIVLAGELTQAAVQPTQEFVSTLSDLEKFLKAKKKSITYLRPARREAPQPAHRPVQPIIFKNVPVQAGVQFSFPGGQKIGPGYEMKLPLGIEKSLGEPAIKGRAEEEED